MERLVNEKCRQCRSLEPQNGSRTDSNLGAADLGKHRDPPPTHTLFLLGGCTAIESRSKQGRPLVFEAVEELRTSGSFFEMTNGQLDSRLQDQAFTW